MVKEDLRRVFIVLLKSIFYSFQIENGVFLEKNGRFWSLLGAKGWGRVVGKSKLMGIFAPN